MSDLISRRDAIDALMNDPDWADAIPTIKSLPSADAVEVVRCKDCLMTKERDEYTNKVWCCQHREYMDDMYYCADGLRRKDGET